MNPDNEGAYTVRTLRCHACAERDKANAVWGDAGPQAAGLYFLPELNT